MKQENEDKILSQIAELPILELIKGGYELGKQETLKEFSERVKELIDNIFRGMPNNANLLKLKINRIKKQMEK